MTEYPAQPTGELIHDDGHMRIYRTPVGSIQIEHKSGASMVISPRNERGIVLNATGMTVQPVLTMIGGWEILPR